MAGWCDLVLEKDAEHHVKPPIWQLKWSAKQAATLIEATHTLVVGGGQAGLCASYYLREKRVPHVVLEREATAKIDGKKYGVMRVIGITRPELKFAVKKGVTPLIAKLKKAGVYPRTDVGRESVI